jgi:glycosyltransferase involved in cell wall biosynthesis
VTAARTTQERLEVIAQLLAAHVPAEAATDPAVRLGQASLAPTTEGAYLIVAVLTSSIPTADIVTRAVRTWRTEGLEALIRQHARRPRLRRLPPVRVTSGIVVDVTDTGRTPFTTGIQRVARESIARWPLEHLELVSWDRTRHVLRPASAAEHALAAPGSPGLAAPDDGVALVPYQATYVLPEIAVARHRYEGLRSLAMNSGSRTVAIGFDCIAVTTGEIAPPGMPAAFAKYLSALAHFDQVIAISDAAADEFEGWRRMLSGAGLSGPRVSVAELPFAVGSVSDAAVQRVRDELDLAQGRPVVVAVGSHEPRKNHVAFLHACELLWQRGDDFAVVMAGGNSWASENFDRFVAELKAKGRPVTTISRASDETIWSLYRLARFSVFCSLNEGFGLPVAESLASGTPVITSDFGSMRSLAANGGVVVNPRDPEAIADAMALLLGDDAAVARLRAATGGLRSATWDDYAEAVWSIATGEVTSANTSSA